MKDYLAAVEREKSAWQALGGRLPGMSGCSESLWAEWMDAVAQLNTELARYTHTQQASARRTPQQPRGMHRI